MVRSIFITILSPTINAPPNQQKMIMPCTSRVLRLGPQSHRRLESAESLRCMSSRSAAFNEVLRLAGSKIWQFQLRQKGCRSLQSMVLRLSRKNAMSTVGMKMWQFSRCERRRQNKNLQYFQQHYLRNLVWQDYDKSPGGHAITLTIKGIPHKIGSNLSPIDRHQGSPLDRLGSDPMWVNTPKSYSFA